MSKHIGSSAYLASSVPWMPKFVRDAASEEPKPNADIYFGYHGPKKMCPRCNAIRAPRYLNPETGECNARSTCDKVKWEWR